MIPMSAVLPVALLSSLFFSYSLPECCNLSISPPRHGFDRGYPCISDTRIEKDFFSGVQYLLKKSKMSQWVKEQGHKHFKITCCVPSWRAGFFDELLLEYLPDYKKPEDDLPTSSPFAENVDSGLGLRLYNRLCEWHYHFFFNLLI